MYGRLACCSPHTSCIRGSRIQTCGWYSRTSEYETTVLTYASVTHNLDPNISYHVHPTQSCTLHARTHHRKMRKQPCYSEERPLCA
ncbi:hypothetical protein L226DRAFT_2077 [Lentinus tigrinus ALCF2SS1-7]|uniref:uncharacterized protein n=1 Tax=Lentinus tigrinus ALCF2SS1-7 TaxID=1328758 RepID=UPI001165EE2B|nr:hypothetical protein L226DRAFT_2077 [Lentinus tigrinus ALCF2SS1-7]